MKSLTPPIVPSDAPIWAQVYGEDNGAVIRALIAEILALQKRLTDAGIA